MKGIIKNPLLVLLMYLLCLYMKDIHRLIVFLLCILYWYRHHSFKSCIFLSCILCMTYFPHIHFVRSDTYRIVDVKSNYAIIENHDNRIVIYTNTTLPFDADVEVSSHIHSFDYDSKFYGFSLYQWSKENNFNGYTYQSEVEVIQQHFTLRSWVQKQIEKVDDNLQKEMLYQIIFRIKSKGIDISDIFDQIGFSYIAGIWLLLYVIKFFSTQRQRKIIKVLCLILLNVFYHYPIVLVYSLLYGLLQFANIPTRVKILVSSVVLLVIFPHALYSLSFQIPLIYRLQTLFIKSHRKIITTLIITCICSIKFQSVQLLSLLFYPVIRYFLGFTWMMGFIQLWTEFNIIEFLAIVSRTISMIQSIKIYGNIIGMGTMFVPIVYLSLKNQKFRIYAIASLMVIFLGISVIHPLSEVTVLNSPKNTNIILKPMLSNCATVLSESNSVISKDLQSYLHAKGINKINTILQKADDMEGIEIIASPQGSITHQLNLENPDHPIWYFHYNQLVFIVFTYLDYNDITYFLNHYDYLDVDVMILANHGSTNANPSELFDSIQPKVCICINQPYLTSHLPSRAVIKEMNKRGIMWMDTGTYGDISFFGIFHKHFALTSSGKIVIIN